MSVIEKWRGWKLERDLKNELTTIDTSGIVIPFDTPPQKSMTEQHLGILRKQLERLNIQRANNATEREQLKQRIIECDTLEREIDRNISAFGLAVDHLNAS